MGFKNFSGISKKGKANVEIVITWGIDRFLNSVYRHLPGFAHPTSQVVELAHRARSMGIRAGGAPVRLGISPGEAIVRDRAKT